ncbi:MAG: hypothetical protein ACOX17_06090 [Christensenellales bacterium]
MDHFLEEAVTRKNKKLFSALYILLTILMICALCLAVYFFAILTTDLEDVLNTGGLFLFVLVFLSFAASFGLFLLTLVGRGKCRMDYEYSFTNGYLEIAAVMNNAKRKEIVGLMPQQILKVGRVGSVSYENLCKAKDKKKIKAWLNKDSEKLFIATTPLAGNKIITFEPSAAMTELIKTYYRKEWDEDTATKNDLS